MIAMPVNSETPEEARARNKSGKTMVITGVCIIILAIAEDAKNPIETCNCWMPLYQANFWVNAVIHGVSALMIYMGAKKLDV